MDNGLIKAVTDIAKIVSQLQDTVITLAEEVKELKEKSNADIE